MNWNLKRSTVSSMMLIAVLQSMFSGNISSACAEEANAKKQQPNFLIILCDDLGYGDLGCYGHPHIKTPHLDKMATQGMRMTSCYSSSPVCSPSRAGLLTGRTPNRTGVYDWIPENHPVHLKKTEKTIASLLKDVGYDTCHVGKWHCNGKFNSCEQPQPNDHGFNHWFSTQNNAKPTHENPVNYVRNGKPVGKQEGFACQLTAKEGIDWLRKTRDPKKPFFLHVCFHEPHEPVASPKELVKKYLPVAKNEDEAHYFGNVENMDRAVGKLMATLDEMKLTDNTIVFFTSDNGPETLLRYGRGSRRSYGSPGKLRGMKLHIYEGGIRVPGIVRYPKVIPAGEEMDDPFSSLDLLPTFCSLAGAKIPQDRTLDGTNWSPLLLKTSEVISPKPLYWHYYRAISQPCVAMRDGDWKIVANWDAPHIYTTPKAEYWNVSSATVQHIKEAKLVNFELYNLKDDLSETTDLSQKNPEQFAQLKAKLLQKYESVQKESPLWDKKKLDQLVEDRKARLKKRQEAKRHKIKK